MEGNCNIFRRAVQRKVDLNTVDGNGDTPLVVAVRYGQEEIVAFLLECNVKVNQTAGSGETPLMIAAQRVSQLLLRQVNTHLNCR